MFDTTFGTRRSAAVLLFLAAGALASGCTRQAPSARSRLRAYIDTLHVVDTHEHQRWYPELDGTEVNLYTILSHSYLRADLVSAGAPELKPEAARQGDLDALWKTYGPAFDLSRNTSYYGQFLAGFRLLYGLTDPGLTAENVRALSARIAANYRRGMAWYAEAFRKAGFETMLVDRWWSTFDTGIDGRFFTLVFNIGPLVHAIAERDDLAAEGAPSEDNIYRLAASEGRPIATLDDYLAASDRLLRTFKERGAVCLKNSMAYSRSLDYDDVPYETAKALFARPPASLSKADRKALEDFMFRWIIGRSVDLALPIQVHTGYLAGNGNVLENGRPTLLNNLFLDYPKARFVLFHGGYPWTGEFAALGKMFPNVCLDLVWLPQISREAAVRGLDEMLDTVPYGKLFWGGDCDLIEESAGSLAFGKDVVAQVLAMRVERGLMTEDLARDVARAIFRENAIRYFRLPL